MKKIFSFLAAVLFAGSMMAKEYTLTILPTDFPGTSYAANNGTHTANAVAADESSIEVEFTTNQIMAQTQNTIIQGQKNTGWIKNEESWGTINSITINDNQNYTYSIDTEDAGKFEIKAGTATSKASSIVIVFNKEESTTPAISAKNIDFGSAIIGTDEDNYVLDTTLAVTGANLTEAIVAAGSENVTVSGTLTAEGGTLNLHIVAAPGDFSETITLTSGETVKEVIISGSVLQPVLLPGEPATMTPNGDTKSYAASVNGVAGVKAGTGSADGSFTVTVPANATVLRFFAIAWTGAAGTIAVSAPEGVTLSQTELTLEADAGISGASNDYILASHEPMACRFDINLSGLTAETEITFASGTARRFVVWGAAYEEGGDVTPTVNYYVAGSMGVWGPADDYMLTPNNQGLYEGEFTFAADDEFKVIGYDGTTVTWFPEGMENNYKITEAGVYKITFNPAGNVEGWYAGYYNVVKKEEPVVPGEEINVTISSLTNPGQVLYADVIASNGYWDIYAFNDQYQIEISNISTTEAAGTYTIDDLDADYTYIVPAEGDTVHFTAGQVVLSITDGVVNVAGKLTGDDNNIYNVNLTYKDPVAEQTVNVNITEGVLYDGYAAYGLYAVYGSAEDGTYVQLAIWTEAGFEGQFTEEDLDNKYVGSGLKDAAGNTQQIYAAAITVTPGAIEGAYTITADLLCYNNTLYKVTMKIGEEQGIDNVDAAVKAIKRLVNGQVVIEKNNKFYNINGAVIR